MAKNELLRSLGEETIYTAKGHFKACDVRRTLVTWTIWTCALLSVLGILIDHEIANKIFSGICLAGMVALLMWNEGDGKNYRVRHKESAEEYLSLHKEIRAAFLGEKCSQKEVDKLSDNVRKLDTSERLEIPTAAKFLAKRAIEKSGETDNWFLKKQE